MNTLKKKKRNREAAKQQITTEHLKTTVSSNATNPSSKKFVPLLRVETRPSLLHALAAFLLHCAALSANFGATAQCLVYLYHQAGHNSDLILGQLTVLAGWLCIVLCLFLTCWIARSAILSNRDACKRIRLEWRSDNTIKLQSLTGSNSSRQYSGTELFQTMDGSYNAHGCLILRLRCIINQRADHEVGPRDVSLVLARDCMDESAYRRMRLWLRLGHYRKPST